MRWGAELIAPCAPPALTAPHLLEHQVEALLLLEELNQLQHVPEVGAQPKYGDPPPPITPPSRSDQPETPPPAPQSFRRIWGHQGVPPPPPLHPPSSSTDPQMRQAHRTDQTQTTKDPTAQTYWGTWGHVGCSWGGGPTGCPPVPMALALVEHLHLPEHTAADVPTALLDDLRHGGGSVGLRKGGNGTRCPSNPWGCTHCPTSSPHLNQ